jgi:hypothetical protein
MRVKLQLVLCSDDGREETVTDMVTSESAVRPVRAYRGLSHRLR